MWNQSPDRCHDVVGDGGVGLDGVGLHVVGLDSVGSDGVGCIVVVVDRRFFCLFWIHLI